jgi:hypothetical protein
MSQTNSSQRGHPHCMPATQGGACPIGDLTRTAKALVLGPREIQEDKGGAGRATLFCVTAKEGREKAFHELAMRLTEITRPENDGRLVYAFHRRVATQGSTCSSISCETSSPPGHTLRISRRFTARRPPARYCPRRFLTCANPGRPSPARRLPEWNAVSPVAAGARRWGLQASQTTYPAVHRMPQRVCNGLTEPQKRASNSPQACPLPSPQRADKPRAITPGFS